MNSARQQSEARSVSRGVWQLIAGEIRQGTAMGRGHVLLGRYVLTLVAPGAGRMPNGVECDLTLERGERVQVGGGRVGPVTVSRETTVWNPVPRPRVVLSTSSDMAIDVDALAGRGPGLTPAGDDLLAGYAAGLVLFHGRAIEARDLAERAAVRTTALSATLLRHAMRGELPEPGHALLEHGRVEPLLNWGSSSGRSLALGLALACGDPHASLIRPLDNARPRYASDLTALAAIGST